MGGAGTMAHLTVGGQKGPPLRERREGESVHRIGLVAADMDPLGEHERILARLALRFSGLRPAGSSDVADSVPAARVRQAGAAQPVDGRQHVPDERPVGRGVTRAPRPSVPR